MKKQNIKFKKIYSDESKTGNKLIEAYEFLLNEIRNIYQEGINDNKVKHISKSK